MIYNMKLNDAEFENLKMGKKTIEVRIKDVKRSKLKIGDYILFHKKSNIDYVFKIKVKNITEFDTFRSLYNFYDFGKFGYDDLEIEEILNKIYSIYTFDQEYNGVLAIEFF